MRKSVIVTSLFVCLLCSAGKVNVLNANVDFLRGQDSIGVSMNYSEAIYNPHKSKYDKNGKKLGTPIMTGDDINVFIKMHRRTNNWEIKSLEYFCEWFNDEITSLTACLDNKNVRYEIVIRIKEVYKSGNIKAIVEIKDLKNNDLKTFCEFISTDGDDDDKITFRDPMKDAGEDIARTFKKLLKIK